MGINLQDTYGSKIRTAMFIEDTNEWYRYRDSMLNKISKICQYYVIYPLSRIPSRAKALTSKSKTPEVKWCEENLQGRFYGMVEQEIEPGRREWIVRFEFEEDAVHFKLRWVQ